jgi:fumarate reductase flavoprotein subunit
MHSIECHDLIVIGSGLAGCSAALTASQAGAEVLLLEKLDAIGGSTALSAGCFAFAGTPQQAIAGITDSDELLYRDLREVGALKNDPKLVQAYVDTQLETYSWLRHCGIEFDPRIEAAAGQTVPRVHTTNPIALTACMRLLCRQSVGIQVQTATAAESLEASQTAGSVSCVAIPDADGGHRLVSASKGVIIATGGFTQNLALMHEFAPLYDDAPRVSSVGATGDGLQMARRLGADLRDMGYIKGTFGKHAFEAKSILNCMAVYKGAIAVNVLGHRFVDESQSYKILGDACMAQPRHLAYQILDQTILEDGDTAMPILDFMRRHEEGLFVTADSVKELATRLELPASALGETINRYNRGVAQGEDPDYGRRHLVHRYGALRPIEQAPFHAYPSTAAIFGTYCGLAVDHQMRILDVRGSPIIGMYAAGEVVGGFHGAAYMTGTALGKAAIFGRLAARCALGAPRS